MTAFYFTIVVVGVFLVRGAMLERPPDRWVAVGGVVLAVAGTVGIVAHLNGAS
jgi:hypothetical protein